MIQIEVSIMKTNLKGELFPIENVFLSGKFNDVLAKIIVSYNGRQYQLYDAQNEQLSDVLSVLKLGTLPELPAALIIEKRLVRICQFHEKTRFVIEAGEQVGVSVSSNSLNKLIEIQSHLQLKEVNRHLALSDVLDRLIYHFKFDNALRAPIYTEIYVICNGDDDRAFTVADADSTYTVNLKKSDTHDLSCDDEAYCLVQHGMDYPYAKFDYEANDGRKFCRTSLVATPKMALIS